MKTFIQIVLICLAMMVGYLISQRKNIDSLKDYQIQLQDSTLLLYDNNNLIGRCYYANTPLDSLILKNNQ